MLGIVKRITVGMCCATVALMLTFAVGEASRAGQTGQDGPVRTDCLECHESVVVNWEQSRHGLAGSDPAFREAWEENGSPPECLSCHVTNYDPESGTWEEDGIACSVCHSQPAGPHPETVMPTDPSSRLCGSCHIETEAQWRVSAHGQGEMTCVRCHNPHTTSLKVGNMRDLCTTCHTDEGHFYAYTGHAQDGMLCTDCHLRVSGSPMGEGHGKRVHTFAVDLQTCNQCHGEGMHAPTDDSAISATSVAFSNYPPANIRDLLGEESDVNDQPAPAPVQPLNYLIVAVVGVGFGAAVTPWAERVYRRLFRKD
jgi:predicted CXXCH cytochrome family protein